MPTIGEIVVFMQAKDFLIQLIEGANNAIIHRPASIAEAVPGEVSFCGATARNPKGLLESTRASLLIIDRGIPFDGKQLAQAGVQAVVLRPNARLDFLRVVKKFFSRPRPQGIHPTAVIAPSAIIASDVFIGPFCTIGENVEIGAGTVIHAAVHIYDHVRIGRNVTIQPGTVIGADGFGYQRNDRGELEKFPSIGGVVIEDDVEICALSHVARGTLGDTIIGQGTKIDSFVHVAHNVQIGKHCIIISHAMLGGADTIGDFSWIAPAACLRDRITIGSGVTVGLGAVVTKDVPDGATVIGLPARPKEEQKRLLRRLSGLAAEGKKFESHRLP